MKKEIHKLKCQMNKMSDVLQISCDGTVTLGTREYPIDNIFTENIGNKLQSPETISVNTLFTDNIVNNDYSLKGINLDDTTAALTPSFDSFPEDWINIDVPVSTCRTFHYTFNTPAWIEWFVEGGMSVMVGITLGDYQNELDAFSADYLAADPDLKELYDFYVIAIGVGNEENTTQITNMNNGMQYAKMLINSGDLPPNAKVTTVLQEDPIWITPTFPPSIARFTSDFIQLVPNLELVCFNMYDGYTNPERPLDERLSWISNIPDNEFSVTLNAFGAMRFAMEFAGLTMPFWCTEFGWESVPGQPGASVPNLETYYNNFLNFNMEEEFYPQGSPHTVTSPDRFFYFTIRDVPSQNKTFGLYTINSTLTPKF